MHVTDSSPVPSVMMHLVVIGTLMTIFQVVKVLEHKDKSLATALNKEQDYDFDSINYSKSE